MSSSRLSIDTKLTQSQAERDAEEEGDYMAFEQLMAEAMQKKGKEEKKKKKDKKHDFLDENASA